jgi:hypothetical protein
MPNWPGSPTFWSNPVGFPYVWRYYQYVYASVSLTPVNLVFFPTKSCHVIRHVIRYVIRHVCHVISLMGVLVIPIGHLFQNSLLSSISHTMV